MSSATIVKAIKTQADGHATTYAWAPGARTRLDPHVAFAEFKTIYDQHGGITPDAVVHRAKQETSPLHGEFEWNNRAAADAHREDQARYLMRHLVIVVRRENGTQTAPIRAIVKVTPDEDTAVPDAADSIYEPRTYVPVMRVMTEQDARRAHLRKAYQDLLAWRRRYQELAEFSGIFEQIDRIRDIDQAS